MRAGPVPAGRGGDTVTWAVLKGLMPVIGNHPSPDSAAERPSLVSLGCHHPSSEHKPPAAPSVDSPVQPQTSRSLLPPACPHVRSGLEETPSTLKHSGTTSSCHTIVLHHALFHNRVIFKPIYFTICWATPEVNLCAV